MPNCGDVWNIRLTYVVIFNACSISIIKLKIGSVELFSCNG